ncbi:hypothetical protein IA854_13570 [Listeria seeligeri]|uniref:hypothetical protein n=1 Tax=Listeria seeligeri TaxID=1640 RepID=UPI001886B68D|nr:hypothetical protein [Listeria seeligeri]MBF2375171.1 hypothetical protein [Listeria seeligeri]
MYYQLEFDKSLNASDVFLYKEKNELLSGVSIWLKFDPVFYGLNDKDLDRNLESLCKSVRVSYDNQKKSFSFENHESIKGKYQIIGYSKDVVEKVESELTKELNELVGFKATMSEPVMIEADEFNSIIENYGNLFENDTSLQSCAYGIHELSAENI